MKKILFSETMSGRFQFKEPSQQEGYMSMRAHIQINDIDAFIQDPMHKGSISGKITSPQLGKDLPSHSGIFQLFAPTDNPKIKHMVYELGFSAQGKSYYLAGHKELKQASIFKLWPATTRLLCQLHEGDSVAGKVIGQGVLTLGVMELLAMLSTFRTPEPKSVFHAVSTLAKFALFFTQALWRCYGLKL